jgi:hypothetical protein
MPGWPATIDWEEDEPGFQGQPSPPVLPVNTSQGQEFVQGAANRGVYVPSSADPGSDFEAMLRSAGVDLDAPEVQWFLQNLPPSMLEDQAMSQLFATQLAAQYPDVPTTQYAQALAASGFEGAFPVTRTPESSMGMGAFTPTPSKFQTQEETGWIRYSNGVLVDPSQGAVIYDPSSRAPGSPAWRREVVSTWSGDKIKEWRERLNEFGYLSKEQPKTAWIKLTLLSWPRSPPTTNIAI